MLLICFKKIKSDRQSTGSKGSRTHLKVKAVSTAGIAGHPDLLLIALRLSFAGSCIQVTWFSEGDPEASTPYIQWDNALSMFDTYMSDCYVIACWFTQMATD